MVDIQSKVFKLNLILFCRRGAELNPNKASCLTFPKASNRLTADPGTFLQTVAMKGQFDGLSGVFRSGELYPD